MTKTWKLFGAAILALFLCAKVAAEPQVRVEGLLPNSAILNIDGERKMLKVGQSHAGVKLLAAGKSSVTLDIGGTRTELGLTNHVGTSYEVASNNSVTIPRDNRSHYFTTAQINGRSAVVMLDTGATRVAMSENQADALGIDYFNGTPSQASTANGIVNTRLITLNTVTIGAITLNGVEASVTEGSFPSVILLGMSFLKRVKMSEKDGILTLTSNQ